MSIRRGAIGIACLIASLVLSACTSSQGSEKLAVWTQALAESQRDGPELLVSYSSPGAPKRTDLPAPKSDGSWFEPAKIAAVIPRLFPELAGLRVARRWAGPMAFTSDYLPVADAAPGMPGVWVGSGFCGHGIRC